MKDKDNKLSKCPLCVHGEIKVINITTNPSPDIDDAYDIQCTHCNSTWCVAVKKGATVENVKLMYNTVSKKGIKVKASGGIKSRLFATDLINAGASRLGTSSGVSIVQ